MGLKNSKVKTKHNFLIFRKSFIVQIGGGLWVGG